MEQHREYPNGGSDPAVMAERVTLSMGISRYPENASSYENCIKNGSRRCTRVKRTTGKKCIPRVRTRPIICRLNLRTERNRPGPGFWQELEKYYKGVSGQKRKAEILSTIRDMESYLNHERNAGKCQGAGKDTENPNRNNCRNGDNESIWIKLEQILPWQDGQYAEVFLASGITMRFPRR